MVLVAPQAGAVSCTLPVQVSPAVPFGASEVAVGPPEQGTGTVVPPVHVGGSGQGTVFVTERSVRLSPGSRFVTEKVQVNMLPGGMGASGQVFLIPIPVV